MKSAAKISVCTGLSTINAMVVGSCCRGPESEEKGSEDQEDDGVEGHERTGFRSAGSVEFHSKQDTAGAFDIPLLLYEG